MVLGHSITNTQEEEALEGFKEESFMLEECGHDGEVASNVGREQARE